MLKRIYVWEFPVRLTHWVNVLSIVVLSFTGYYVGAPFIHALEPQSFTMGWMRFIHFTAAYLFTISFLVRIYWMFMGNKHASWRVFNPFSSEKMKDLVDISKFYLLLSKEPPAALMKPGHTACATYVYLGLFVLFVAQILTGFALYSMSHHGFLWTILGGWVLALAHEQTLRLYHHIIMWLMISFAIIHVYIGWFVDRTERSGLMSSIFSGYKVEEK
ncbi:MAG: Ni/Fe-hydrogenase, b-type cytochrome subunit [Nitrospirales bacterium]|nr:Ni/Fe-hydrogenase, b-type cytochrome subunit [Nitrospirales bacterium]